MAGDGGPMPCLFCLEMCCPNGSRKLLTQKIFIRPYQAGPAYFPHEVRFSAGIGPAHFPAGGTAIDASAAAIFTF